ncbi:MAG: nucleotidyl transferase AbiEii/AbiGii toxin family protein [Phycisphaerales bacterium]
MIDRFSEDIDLAIDYAPLGFAGDRDPRADMSRTRRELLLDELMAACRAFVAGPVVEAIRARCDQTLGRAAGWSATLSARDPNTIEFEYPLSGVTGSDYVRPRILLECGTHAELVPSGRYSIAPFAAEQFPRDFERATCAVKAITAERTFWEKATILHAEHHRPADKPLPMRHARHYYDMAMLARSTVCDPAVRDLDLLQRVVEHKTKFYSAGWARYDLAVPETLSLLPTDGRVGELRSDYEAMSSMIFGRPPRLDDLLEDLARLEARINAMRRAD